MISVENKSLHKKPEGGEIVKMKVAGHTVMNTNLQAPLLNVSCFIAT